MAAHRYLVSPDGEFLDFYTQMANDAEIVGRITNQVAEFEEAATAKAD